MKPLYIATVVGARPQFIKAAPISRAIAKHNESGAGRRIEESLIHTGQHYDYEMSAVFFTELGLPEPAHHLNVGSGTHGAQTGEMLKRLEETFFQIEPGLVLVFGDTNSTLAGALAAAKLHIPVAHVEAGLRSFNRRMPEEINRVMTDHISNLLFCPSEQSVGNLAEEGISRGVHMTGDVMYDVMRWHLERAKSDIVQKLNLQCDHYAVATVHRAESTDDPGRLRAILGAVEELSAGGLPVVLPLHPRTQKAMQAAGIEAEHTRVIPPVSYEEMLSLSAGAEVILTDSGGLQKEAYWLGVPCVTLRTETEWVETVEAGWNVLASYDPERIMEAAHRADRSRPRPELYGDGNAAERIVAVLIAPPDASIDQGHCPE